MKNEKKFLLLFFFTFKRENELPWHVDRLMKKKEKAHKYIGFLHGIPTWGQAKSAKKWSGVWKTYEFEVWKFQRTNVIVVKYLNEKFKNAIQLSVSFQYFLMKLALKLILEFFFHSLLLKTKNDLLQQFKKKLDSSWKMKFWS